jgi:hypothetical protein
LGENDNSIQDEEAQIIINEAIAAGQQPETPLKII